MAPRRSIARWNGASLFRWNDGSSTHYRGPRIIAVADNPEHLWSEQHGIKTRTKRNHSRTNSGRLTIGGNYSRSPYVIATSHFNATGMKSADLAGIFAAERPTWADGTPVRIILRPRSDTDTALLGELFAGMTEAIESARRRAEVRTAG